jgi:hypothetical protein
VTENRPTLVFAKHAPPPVAVVPLHAELVQDKLYGGVLAAQKAHEVLETGAFAAPWYPLTETH